MKIIKVFFLIQLIPLVMGAQSEQRKGIGFVEECTVYAAGQTRLMLQATGEPAKRNYPRTVRANGRLVTTGMYDWTPGFFPGNLWLLYELTGDTLWRNEARRWTGTLEPLKTFTGHHDLGFMMYCSYGNAARLAPMEGDSEILVRSARSLATRFNPRTGTIKSWNRRMAWDGVTMWHYPVIIDNMMNLEMLFHAARVSGEKRLRDVAVRHAETTLKNHFREDFTTYHVVNYDTLTGDVLNRATCQGYADNSTWSRGQAWAIYGYTMVYRETGEARFLDAARRAADVYLKMLPEDDLLPPWDFNAGQPGYVPEGESYAAVCPGTGFKDVSAAAIVCSALFELGVLADEPSYLHTAVKMLHALRKGVEDLSLAPCDREIKRPESATPFILGHSVGSLPHRQEIDAPLVYADYYFLEALVRYKQLMGSERDEVRKAVQITE